MSQFPTPPPVQPMPYAQAYPAQNNDLQHLKLLAIFHWVWGGLIGLFSCLGILYLVLGIVFLSRPTPALQVATATPTTRVVTSSGTAYASAAPATVSSQDDERIVGIVFTILGAGMLVIGITVCALNIYSGFGLLRQRRRTLSLVVSGINCLSIPFGTTLGVFTIVVLVRASVKSLYDTEAQTRHGRP